MGGGGGTGGGVRGRGCPGGREPWPGPGGSQASSGTTVCPSGSTWRGRAFSNPFISRASYHRLHLPVKSRNSEPRVKRPEAK